jgi:hypothetical protein
MIQEKIGQTFAVVAVILYSDVTTITKNLKVWAVYGKFKLICVQMCFVVRFGANMCTFDTFV